MWTKTLSSSPSKAQAKAQPKALPLSQPILRWALAAALALMLPATAAMAAPVSYQLSSGSATIRGTLAGSSESIFVGPAAIDAPIISARTVIDQDAGPNGRVEQIGSLDPNAPNIEVKADFTFRGVLENPIPEPSAALLFLVGASVAGSSIRRRR